VLSLLNEVSNRMGAEALHAYDPESWHGQGAAAAFTLPSYTAEAQLIAQASEQITKADPQASIGVIARSGWRRRKIDEAFAELPSLPCRRWDLAIEDPAILERLRRVVASMPRNVTFEAAEAAVIAGIDPSDVDTIEQVSDAFGQLAAEATCSVRATLNQLRVRSDNEAISPGVHLLNAHTGKGQQFDWVFVPGLEEKHLPDRRSTAGAELAEEQRVLLVMLSRARHGVVITRSTTAVSYSGEPYTVRKSRWWDGLAAAATMDFAGLNSHLDKFYSPAV
jgi:DNA helicase-2/ATP-dependent DNA helicase PcrA